MKRSSGPKPGAEQTPPPVQPKTDEKADDKAKKTAGNKEEESNLLKGTQLEKLGSIIAYDIEKLMTIFGKFYDKMLNFDASEYFGMSPKEQSATLTAIEQKTKIPKIEDAKKLKTKLENPKPGDSLVAYLYRTMHIPLPKASEIDPPTNKVTLQHLTIQLKQSGVYFLKGPNAIMQKIKKDPPKYRKGDFVVTQHQNKKFEAGLILAINDKEVTFQNNQAKPVTRPVSELFLAYHLNGNTEVIPETLKK